LPDTLKQGMSRSERSTQIRTDIHRRSGGGTKGSIVARGAKWNHNIHYHDVLLAFISALAVLHHMPFAPALEKAKAALRPGGVLAILGLYRVRTPVDLAVTAAAAPVNRGYLLAHGCGEYAPPIAEATMTLRQIRRSARDVLPGASVRRHLLWRYSLIWQRPVSGGTGI
jgi:SAM-dependent methyltransferase